MSFTQPNYASSLVGEGGRLEKPLVDLLRALASATSDSGTAAILSALADRVTALENATWNAQGLNGIAVYGDESQWQIVWNGTTSNVPEGSNLYFTDARARAAAVADSITDAITDIAPSQNAVFDALALKAPLASPTFTGNPTAPTPSAGDNDTSIATTAFVATAVTAAVGQALVPTVMSADYTVGANTQALFTLPIDVGTFNLVIDGDLIEVA